MTVAIVVLALALAGAVGAIIYLANDGRRARASEREAWKRSTELAATNDKIQLDLRSASLAQTKAEAERDDAITRLHAAQLDANAARKERTDAMERDLKAGSLDGAARAGGSVFGRDLSGTAAEDHAGPAAADGDPRDPEPGTV